MNLREDAVQTSDYLPGLPLCACPFILWNDSTTIGSSFELVVAAIGFKRQEREGMVDDDNAQAERDGGDVGGGVRFWTDRDSCALSNRAEPALPYQACARRSGGICRSSSVAVSLNPRYYRQLNALPSDLDQLRTRTRPSCCLLPLRVPV